MSARVEVQIGDPRLAGRVARRIEAALERARMDSAAAIASTADLRIVRLRTRRRLAALGPEAVSGALVLVRLTERGARHLVALVAELRAASVAGIQLVWDGVQPTRELAEGAVFAALEQARAAPKGPPVVLARGRTPTDALRIMVARRRERSR